ncbi:serine hydrolase [Desulfovibrio inopinatus]|uniref:serine hydrolase n=1 Tax=Desulfovibrio inopinatus TaxID=102109 RepID=UPI00042905A5|nr:serine hydrolase domain-containing protein [Desulfovibrio inopinatus]
MISPQTLEIRRSTALRIGCFLLTMLLLCFAHPTYAADAVMPSRANIQTLVRPVTPKGTAAVVGLFGATQSRFYGFGPINGSIQNRIFSASTLKAPFTGSLLAEAILRGRLLITAPLKTMIPETTIPKFGDSPLTLFDAASLQVSFAPLQLHLEHTTFAWPGGIIHQADLTPTAAPAIFHADYPAIQTGLVAYALTHRMKTDFPRLAEQNLFRPMHMDTAHITEDGQVHLSVHDMATFVTANLGRTTSEIFTILRLTHLARVQMPQTPGQFTGLLWRIFNTEGQEYVYHVGHDSNGSVSVFLDPVNNIAFFILTDADVDVSTLFQTGLHGIQSLRQLHGEMAQR